VISNESADDTICQVFFSLTTNDDWEDNQLGGLFSSLDPGETESFEVDAGEYDLRMEDCDHNLLLQEMGITIEGEYAVNYAGRGDLDSVLTVSNDSSQTICWVYFSPTTSDMWGGDQLGVGQMLESGQSRTYEVASNTYDILLADCDENTLLEEYEVDISGEYTVNYTE
jgi:uncharacterized protein (DUF2249 family)